jgi:protein subunit release factor B
MGKFKVSQEKEKKLIEWMEKLGLKEKDIIEKFILGSGSGGQKINKTSSCVYLIHKPTKIEIKCQQNRSQALNRFLARRELCEKLEERILGAQSRKQQEIEKIRRQKRKRSKRAKEKILNEKRKRSLLKDKRKPIQLGKNGE